MSDIIEEIASLVGKRNITMPSVEVLENGHSVSNPRIDPSVMNFLLLASIAHQEVIIRKYTEDRTSNGRVRNYDCDVTERGERIDLDYAAQSISIINGGPNAVYIKFNEDVPIKPSTLENTESLDVNFETHVIKLLYLRCDVGDTASLRIVAKS